MAWSHATTTLWVFAALHEFAFQRAGDATLFGDHLLAGHVPTVDHRGAQSLEPLLVLRFGDAPRSPLESARGTTEQHASNEEIKSRHLASMTKRWCCVEVKRDLTDKKHQREFMNMLEHEEPDKVLLSPMS